MTGLRGPIREVSSESQLVGRLASGDSAALWELWQEHQTELRPLCRRWMGGRAEDAEDALSTAMLKTWELLPGQAAELVNVRAWLLRLTYNVCMDFHREHQRRARLVDGLGEPAVPVSELAASPHSPEEALLRRELSSWVRHAIDDLPVRLRQPVVLRFFREMPHRDIAERLKLSSDNVRKRLQYARGILGLRLKGLLSGPAVKRPAEPRLTAVTGPVRPPTPRERRRLATLRRYVERHPRGWKKRLELAQILGAIGRGEEAQAEYGRARERWPAPLSTTKRAS
jgi:RNA polymerase sigma factor (sigma-70 family)